MSHEKLEKDLDTLAKSIKGKNKLDAIKQYEQQGNNSKEDLLRLSLELYKLSKKAIGMLQKTPISEDTKTGSDPVTWKELRDYLPGVLKGVLKEIHEETSTVPEVKDTKE